MPRSHVRSVVFEQRPDHQRLQLCRPERYNVLDITTLATLSVDLATAGPCYQPLVISGLGEVFSLGCDIRELATFSAADATTYSRLGQQTVAAIEAWPGLTIGWLQGYALGSGLELALGCDLLIADPGVRIGLPGLAWALMPCLGGLRRLAGRVGKDLASDLLLRGTVLDGPAALASGLVDRLVVGENGLACLLHDFADFPPGAVRAIRELRLGRHGIQDIDTEAELFAQPFISGECQKRLRMLP